MTHHVNGVIAASEGRYRSGNMAAASLSFNGDGTLSGSGSSSFAGGIVTPGGNAFVYPTGAGVASDLFLKLTRTSGLNFSQATSYTQINSGLTGITSTGGAGATSGTWQIATDATGATVLCGGHITVNNAA